MTKLADVFRFVIKDLIDDGWRTTITILNLLVFICSYFALVGLAEAAYNFGNQPTDKSALLIISRNVFDPSESAVTERDFIQPNSPGASSGGWPSPGPSSAHRR